MKINDKIWIYIHLPLIPLASDRLDVSSKRPSLPLLAQEL